MSRWWFDRLTWGLQQHNDHFEFLNGAILSRSLIKPVNSYFREKLCVLFHFHIKNNFIFIRTIFIIISIFYLYFLEQLLKMNKKVMIENSFLEHIFDIISISVCGLASKNKRTFWTQTRANRKVCEEANSSNSKALRSQ